MLFLLIIICCSIFRIISTLGCVYKRVKLYATNKKLGIHIIPPTTLINYIGHSRVKISLPCPLGNTQF